MKAQRYPHRVDQISKSLYSLRLFSPGGVDDITIIESIVYVIKILIGVCLKGGIFRRFKASLPAWSCFWGREGSKGHRVQLLPLMRDRIDVIFDVIHLKNRPLLDWPQRMI